MAQLTYALDREEEIPDSNWKWLYKAAGAASLLMLALIPVGAIPFMVTSRPATVTGWFELIQSNRLLGLALLDVPNLVVNLVGILVFLALFAALRHTYQSLTMIGAVLGIVAAALYVTTNPAFAMLALTDQYSATATADQKSALLAAGQAMLTIYQSSTAYTVSYIFGAVATLILSTVMILRGNSKIFGKGTAWAGILASIITLGLFIPQIGLYVSIFSLLPYAFWLVSIARKFFRLGQD